MEDAFKKKFLELNTKLEGALDDLQKYDIKDFMKVLNNVDDEGNVKKIGKIKELKDKLGMTSLETAADFSLNIASLKSITFHSKKILKNSRPKFPLSVHFFILSIDKVSKKEI